MARRGRGEGSVRRRADGRWEASVTLGGERRSFYGKTRAEVVKKLGTAQREHEQGLLVGDGRQTVEQYFNDWLEAHRPPNLAVSTWVLYDARIRSYFLPVMGRTQLRHVSAQHVQQVITACQGQGRSSGTTAQVFGLLRQILKDAVRAGVIAQNVTDRLARPKRTTPEMRPFTRAEAQQFLASVQQHRLASLFKLALATGMRIGEVMALRWRDVDLDKGRLSVTATLRWRAGVPVWSDPKTRRSRRQIALAPEMVQTLREHRHQQRLQQIAAGAAWQGEKYGCVFTDELGFPHSYDRLRRQFSGALKQAGLPRIRLHDLRHTCATLLLRQGINPKVVSELLGHSSVSITLDIYSHVLPDIQEEAARAMSTALGW